MFTSSQSSSTNTTRDLPNNLAEWMNWKPEYRANADIVREVAIRTVSEFEHSWFSDMLTFPQCQSPLDVIGQEVALDYLSRPPSKFEENGIDFAHLSLQKYVRKRAFKSRTNIKSRGENRELVREAQLKKHFKINPSELETLIFLSKKLESNGITQKISEQPFDSEELQHAMALLPQRSQTILYASFSEQLNLVDIAQQLGLSPSTVCTDKAKALRQLRRILERD